MHIKDYGKIYLSYQEKGSDLYMTYNGVVLDYEDNYIATYCEEELEEIILLADSLSNDDFYFDNKLDGSFSIVTVYNDDKIHYIKCHACSIANSQYKKLVKLLKKHI